MLPMFTLLEKYYSHCMIFLLAQKAVDVVRLSTELQIGVMPVYRVSKTEEVRGSGGSLRDGGDARYTGGSKLRRLGVDMTPCVDVTPVLT